MLIFLFEFLDKEKYLVINWHTLEIVKGVIMNRLTRVVFPIIVSLIAVFIISCAGGGGPVIPGSGNASAAPNVQVQSESLTAEKLTFRKDRVVWGIWNISIDPETLEATIEPLRSAMEHIDVTSMVTPPNCTDCLGIQVLSVDPVTNIFYIKVSLKNPTKKLTGYDVRGTLLFPKGDNRELVNADDFTTIFDDSTPPDINPFKAFAKNQPQRAFGPGKVYFEEYHILFPPPANLKVLFVIDASWPENQEEVYTIDNFKLEGGVNECNSAEGWLYCDVNDWQSNVTDVTLDLKAIGGGVVPMQKVINKTYRYYLNNEAKNPAGTYKLLITANSQNTTYALYDYYKLEIKSCTNTPPVWDDTIGVVQLKPVSGGLEVYYGTASDPDKPVTYRIYYSENKPIEWTTASKITDADGSPGLVSGLSDAKTYWIGVRAVDSLGAEEKNTVQLSGVPSNPPVWVSTVGITGAIAKNKAVEVTYGTATDPQTPVTYNVYWSSTSPINFATASKINDTASPTEVTGLDNFKPYYFAVRAVDGVGAEDTNTKEMVAIPNGPPEWVGPVGIQSTKPGNGAVTVTYGTAIDIDLPVTYTVYYSESSPINFATASKVSDPDGSPCTIGGLINNKTYYFAVRAKDSTNNEETNTVELPGTPNSAPTWENDLIGVQSLIPFDQQVTVFYGHALDPDLPITYHIYYSKTSPINFATAQKVTTTSESPKVVTGLDNYVPYYFAVRAEDSVGIMETNTVELSTIPNPAPVWNTTIGIQALDAQNQSLIAHYGTAHDLDMPVSYRVYYQDSSPINFLTAPYVDDAGGSPTTIPGLQNGKKYWVAVRARDVYGHEEQNTVTMSQIPQGLPVQVWSVFTGGVVQASPMLADLNKDNILDVICGDQANKVVAYSGVNGLPIWTFPTAGWVDSSAAVADMNADDVPDVIFGCFDKKVYCVNGATGGQMWSATTGGAIISSPTLANIKGDFHLDVIIGAMDGKVYAFDGANGAPLWNFPTGAGVFSSPANADMNGDMIPDIVVGSRDGKIYALDGTSGTQLWAFPTGQWVNSSPALVNLNADSVPDVVCASLNGNVYAINGATGAQIWAFPAGSYIWTSPSIGYINGDSVPDVVLGADNSNIYAINGATGGQLWSFKSSDRVWSSAALVDLNQDNTPDALVGSDDGNLYGIDGASGNLMFAFPTGDWIDSSPAVGDIDGDGSTDIVFGRYDGYLTVIENQGIAPGIAPWPMFRKDLIHTARF